MALQKSAEIFRPPVAAPITSFTAVIPNEVRNPLFRISVIDKLYKRAEKNFEMGSTWINHIANCQLDYLYASFAVDCLLLLATAAFFAGM
jgi:hypothetical protein